VNFNNIIDRLENNPELKRDLFSLSNINELKKLSQTVRDLEKRINELKNESRNKLTNFFENL